VDAVRVARSEIACELHRLVELDSFNVRTEKTID
jgi:hypothetical protein